MKKSRKLKIFLMLKVIEEKFNIGLNELAGMRTENGMMLFDLIVLQKLLRIFMLIIPISRNLKQKKITRR